MGAEQAKQTADEVVELTDRALHALGPMGELEGKRDFDRYATDLAYLGNRIAPTLGSIAASLEKSRTALHTLTGYNLLAADAISGMPTEEITGIERSLLSINAGAEEVETEYINPVAGLLEPVRPTTKAAEDYAGHLRQSPEISGQEGSWTWLYFAYRVLRRVAGAI